MKLKKPQYNINEQTIVLYVSENCTNGVQECCGVGGSDQCRC